MSATPAIDLQRLRRSADQAMRERARVERLVQSARGIAIIGTDELGRINLFSPGAELILGYSPDEVYGHSTRMFHTRDEIARQAADLGCDPAYLEVVRATAALPPGVAREWEFVRKDGSPRRLSTILSPITDEHGAFMGYVATADDITDRYNSGQFDVAHIAYSEFKSVLAQDPKVDQIIPVVPAAIATDAKAPVASAAVEYEPDEETILADLLPRNVAIQIYRALLENAAGFYGSQMTAMDNATRNAGDMINRLSIQYNRQRQAAITTELVEIISGAEAL